MLLKRLELTGFKSFPDKIKLEFNEGITAVVGPNGSGKSNISDAILWVLGEQSAKSLRGDNMQDVIFAGTENRKPVGFAEVSLVLDNEDGSLPIDYEEVVVTRKLYRSGESEYFINRNPCRLMDIHELFFDTGIGKEGYSIIGQGKIDDILSAKSEDRRLLLEEAAGIFKFRSKRDSALRKLEKQAEHLVRINDIIGEISIQIGPLQENARKARNFLELSETLKEIETKVFLEKNAQYEQVVEKNKQQINIVMGHMEQEKRMETLSQKRYADISEKIDAGLYELEDLRKNFIEERLTGEQQAGKINLSKQTLEHLLIDQKRLEEEQQDALLSLEIFEKDLQITIRKNQEKEWTYEKKQHQIKSHSSIIDALHHNLKDLDLEIKNKTLAEKKYIEKENELRTMIQVTKSEQKHLYEALNNQGDKKDQEIQEQSSIQEKLSKWLERENTTKESICSLEKDIIALEKKGFSAREVEKNLQNTFQHAKHETENLLARKEMLQSWEDNNTGYNRGVQALLAHYAKEINETSGIFGPVGSLIEVQHGYELAIETALGFSIQHIVCRDEQVAKEAIHTLQRLKAGRATFLPIETMEARVLSKHEEAWVHEKGVLGQALHLISYSEKFHPVMANMLGRVFVLEDMDAAIIFSRKTKNRFKLVTRTGEQLHIGGAISGGSDQNKRSILGRSNEIKELTTKIQDLEISTQKTMTSLEAQRNIIKDLLEAHDLKNKSLMALTLEQKSLEIEINRYENDLHRFKASDDFLLQDNNRLIETLEKTEEKLFIASSNTSELIEKIAYIQQEKETLEIEKDAKTLKLSTYEETYLGMQIDISQAKQTIEMAQKEITDFQEKISFARDKEMSASEKMLEIAENKQVLTERIENDTREHKEREDSFEDMKENINQLETMLKTEKTTQKEFEHKRNEHKDAHNKLEQEKIRLEGQGSTTLEKQRHLKENMWEAYQITIESTPDEKIGDNELLAYEKRIIILKETIRKLGSVYLGAIEEVSEQEKRLEDLTTQRQDIVEAEEKLLDIIKDLNKHMERQFASELKRISNSFSQVFSDMFGGGKAYLELTDPDRPLTSGVDIISQPPGKRLQNMQLFSGGEKALTAISLLFGIFNLKPSPFSVLDEIESALDDANVKRFADYLLHFGKHTQFIVITHRKGTMENADTLYGVTMQEKGISTIVSVSLEEAI